MPVILDSNNRQIPVGADLIAVNGHRINDFLDFHFYHEPGQDCRITIRHNGRRREIHISARTPLNLKLSDPVYRRCQNDCTFCFVNGLPDGLRSELYFRDDDYRLSFLFGNFLSLTNLTGEDICRIGRLRLSPLYVSVHATVPAVRRRIFRQKRAGLIMEQLKKLIRRGIAIHAQVVVLPGINDAAVLNRTLKDLIALYPGVASIGVVPVGVSRFLKGIRPMPRRAAAGVLTAVQRFHVFCRQKFGRGLVYAADEFYLKTGTAIPAAGYYDGFPQQENGIGMVRRFMDETDQPGLRPPRAGRFLFLTGELAYPCLRRLARILNDRAGNNKTKIEVQPVRNRFFGSAVNVAGLLTGQDLEKSISRKSRKFDRIVLPPNCVNEKKQFLDNWTIDDHRVIVAPATLKELMRCL